MICLGDTTTLLPLLLRSASACSLADIRPYSFVTELAMDLNTRESFGDLLVPISIIFFWNSWNLSVGKWSMRPCLDAIFWNFEWISFHI